MDHSVSLQGKLADIFVELGHDGPTTDGTDIACLKEATCAKRGWVQRGENGLSVPVGHTNPIVGAKQVTKAVRLQMRDGLAGAMCGGYERSLGTNKIRWSRCVVIQRREGWASSSTSFSAQSPVTSGSSSHPHSQHIAGTPP
eukprot:CAMPEP_0174294602 /NCGR_PEP_ID=MMETSP0809-20121228/42149_1 /TAXON_ID=73025 ORGANISM="Eutreptiella gymnastica-like, Strain CCMP1594" /NCGR_SAMPLE_ID=MMETSP0809 /ASSEMBLY_ACC=CAM_ASM_000658 /LENGTH=141 /DNA_ID=CAMNT_0015396199 /DNA_START=387 /DNA_END=809 /DNA_ORIENTATION=-